MVFLDYRVAFVLASQIYYAEIMLSCAVINLFGFLSLVFLSFSKGSEKTRNSRLKTCSDLIKLTPHFQKLPHLKFLQNYLHPSGFLCPTLVNNFSILYYKYLELDELYCYYLDPINSALTESQRKCLPKLLSRINSDAPYFHLCDFAEWNLE